MKRQRGFSLLVVMALGIVAAAVALLFLKVVPVYSEYAAIKKSIDELAASQGKGEYDLRNDFTRNATVQDIVSIKAQDLVIIVAGSQVGVGVQYERAVPLTAKVKLVFSFEHQAGVPVLKNSN